MINFFLTFNAWFPQSRGLLYKLSCVFFMLCLPILAHGQAKTVKGKVTAASDGFPLPGVTVIVKGTTTGTITNAAGEYSLNVPDQNTVLEFSFIGFERQEVPLNGRSAVDVVLAEVDEQLQEVVVIGYGAIKKSNVTGAIVSVKTEELQQVPTTNVMESLQGKLPGVDIVRESGAAGAGINIRVRGNRSVRASNQPLFIVDGIQYDNIQDLNPNDIASMEVLKDAASTAIYGSRGANGVIIVSTKQGAAGKTRISFNSYYGLSQPVNYPEVFSASEYVAFRQAANGVGPDDFSIFSPYEIQQIEQGRGTNWSDLLFRDGALQDYQLGLSSGTDKSNFYVSLNYFNEKGVLRKDDLSRYSLRANINHAFSNKFKIGTQNQLTFYDINTRRDPLGNALKMVPLYETHEEDGSFAFYPNNDRHINPLADEQPDNYLNNGRNTRIFSSVYASWQILDHLSFRSNLGVTLGQNRRGIYAGALTIDRNGQSSQASLAEQKSLDLNLENILSYDRNFGMHSLGLTAVQSYLSRNEEQLFAQGDNQLLNRQLFYALQNANDQVKIRSAYAERALLSFTGRARYSYKDKYMLMLTGRSDGASQLSPGRKWAFFPSVSAAWRIIEEDFLSNVKLFSDLKLRASYGVAGNASVNPYDTQSLLARIPFGFGDNPAIGYGFAPLIGNDEVGWEITTTYNAGLDFGLFQNRLTGNIDVYTADTDDLLLPRYLPAHTGVQTVIQNVGSVENKGLEIGLNAIAIDRDRIGWSVGLNWFANRERFTSLASGANDIANGWFVGYPQLSYFDYEFLGIWQKAEEGLAAEFGQAPGDIKVKDQNGDGEITNDDRVVVGSAVPKWSVNFSNDFRFGNFDLNLQLFARWGQTIPYELYSRYDPQGLENSFRHNYWTPENSSNEFPRPDKGRSRDGTLYYTSLQYKDGSFLKLRNISLGYTLPQELTDRFNLGRLRAYVTGRNVFVHSKIKDYDPERGGAISSPLPRLFVGGINLEF